ncbi:MAG TPA: ElyC/SanA/YdcF family protein [Vicinamibacterales bacterium]
MTNRRSDVLCISSIDWDFIWQGHQEIMATLAAQGHRVLFLENTGVRSPGVRDLPRVRQRVRNWWKGTKGFREERPNLFVYSPLLIPLPYSRVARWVNRFLLLRSVRRWMRAIGFFRPIIWTFLPTPLTLDLVRDLDPQLIVYYCIDDFASSSTGARRIVASEARLFGAADLVFVTSEKLRQRAALHGAHVHLFPFGVSVELFDRVRRSAEPPPADLQALQRPVIGYVGGLHQWVDQALVADVASRMPDATFALVGPAQTDVSALARCPNIRLLGRRAHDEVPAYVKGFDVAIVPYRLTEYTANVYPTKLNEYLVMGVPVVATDLPEIRRFNADHGGVVQIAGDATAFAAALRGALTDSSGADVERRVAVAHANSWQSRIAAMNLLIDDAVDRRTAARQRWDETLRRVYRRARTHIAQVVLALTAASVVVFYTPVVWWVAAPLKIEQPAQRADAIVVLAGGVGESASAGGGVQERLKQAIDLYKAGNAPYLVFSSGFVYSFREAEVMRALAIDRGIPAGAIVLEQHSTNTHQMAVLVNDILNDRHWTSILLVSSPYHMRRVTMVWRKVAPAVRVIPVPPPGTQFYDHGWGASLEQVGGILWEYAAIVDYWRRGWL